jgi:hypothetical protein
VTASKGYVVRGKNPQGVGFFSPAPTLAAAIREWGAFMSLDAVDVRIFAVTADGETPLPTYGEALALLGAARRLAAMAQSDIDERDLGEAMPHEWHVLGGVLERGEIGSEARRLLEGSER